MDTSDIVRLILLLVALGFSAFFSASEAAFLSVQRSKLAALVQRRAKGADRVARIAGRPEKLFPTVLTGNNLVNVAAAALGTALATSYLSPNWAVVASIGGVTVLLLVFGEILPKTVAAKNAEGLAMVLVRPLQVAAVLFFPAVWLLERLSHITARFFGASGATTVTEEEIRSLIDVAETEGVVEKSEAEMLEKVFHFGDRQVGEVMTPRTDIVWVEKNSTLQDFLGIYARETHTRFPVFEGDQENVVGLLSVKDLLEEMAQGTVQLDDSVTKVLRPVHLVPETKLVAQLFDELREKGQQMAIAIDQHGGVAGLVTLKRLLEVIVGPVGEEGEPVEEDFVAMGQDCYEVNASISIEEANDKLGMDLPEGGYQTLAGFILKQLGRIPHEGDHFHYNDMRLEVKEMQRVKVARVEVRWLSPQVESITS